MAGRGHAKRLHLRTQILLSLAVVLLSIQSIAFVQDLKSHGAFLSADAIRPAEDFERRLRDHEAIRTRAMAAVAGQLMARRDLEDAVRRSDTGELLSLMSPAFEDVSRAIGATHLYVHGTDGENLLRVHNPAGSGGPVDRWTYRRAAETGEPQAGFEGGKFGVLTLRYVAPWMIDGRPAAYIELGVELDLLIEELETPILATIPKERIDKDAYLGTLDRLDRTGDWDEFPGVVVAYSNSVRLRRLVEPDLRSVSAHRMSAGHTHPHGAGASARHAHGEPHAETNESGGPLRELVEDGDAWLLLSAVDFRDAGGDLATTLFTFRDVTTLVSHSLAMVYRNAAFFGVVNVGVLALGYFVLGRIERALVTRTEAIESLRGRLERAVGGTSDGLWEYDPGTGEVWYADQFKRLLCVPESGFSAFEPTLSSFVDRLHPDDKAGTLEAVRSHIEDRTPYNVVYRLRTDDGPYRWFRARGTSTRDLDGSVLRMSGSICDIHEQHNAQIKIEEQRRELQSIIDAIPGFVYYKDDRNTILDCNRTAAESIGLPRERIRNRPTTDFFPAADAAAELADDLEVIRSGEPRLAITEQTRGSRAERRHIRTDKIPLRGPGGVYDRLVAIATDITETVHAKEEAEAASRAKSEFLANMSHEIRTPMTAILGFADVLGDGDERDPAREAEAIGVIRSNATHLMSILNDILDMSKIEAGQMKLESIECDPRRIIGEVASVVAPRCEDKGIAFRMEFGTPMPATIRSDPTRLRQVLLNLAGNAVKFTERGRVTVRASCDPAARRLRLSVIDTGIGLSPGQCASIRRFRAFNQADSSMTRRFGGSGLGLRIANELAHRLGGELDFESVEGEGSTFTVTVGTGDLEGVEMVGHGALAADSGSPAAHGRAGRAGVSSRPLEGVRILLAEDGPDNQRLISFLLRKAGADVAVCENGLVAATTIEGAPREALPHLVLMDMQMPELDGYDATRRLRAHGFDRPIVALTAHAMSGDRERCLDAGCDDYLTKPITKHTLIGACARWSDAGGERARSAA